MATTPPPPAPSKFPSELFQKGVHDCPSCGSELSSTASACPRCHFQIKTLDEVFAKEAPALETIMDFEDILKKDDAKIRHTIAHSERKFPQLKLSFCSLTSPAGPPANIAGWWILNKGKAHDSTPPSWCGILLVDPHSRQITFQSGYDLEVFVSRQELEALLTECAEWFALEEWAGGVNNFFKEFHLMLKKAHREALQTLKLAEKAHVKA